MSTVLKQLKKTSDTEPARVDVLDRRNRSLRDLRISVIDQCNFRCTYCMPDTKALKQHAFVTAKARLSVDEIERLVRIFTALGVRKVRLTGGEPLLRTDLPFLIKRLQNIDGLDDLGLTTNGLLLERQAAALHRAGLNRITVSLDALDEITLAQISGGRANITKILNGIDVARRCGLYPIKLNMVVMRGVNDQEVLPLLEHFRHTGVIVRFIEYMDTGTINHWQRAKVVPSKELVERINQRWPLQTQSPNYIGEVAARYSYTDGAGEIGFISSVSQPFCGACTRARITSDGKLYTCLFGKSGFDLRTFLRDGASDEEITESICGVWKNRDDRYSELRKEQPNQTLQSPEMFYLGG